MTGGSGYRVQFKPRGVPGEWRWHPPFKIYRRRRDADSCAKRMTGIWGHVFLYRVVAVTEDGKSAIEEEQQ